MLCLRQLKSLVFLRRSCRPHPYLSIVAVYSLLLLLSHLLKLQLRPGQQLASSIDKREAAEEEEEEMQGDSTLPTSSINLLTASFKAADFDGNKLLSSSELAMAISRQTKQHIMHAMRNNFRVFFALDRGKKNGQVDWEEYYHHFLVDLLKLDKETVAQLKNRPATVARKVKESISRVKAAWYEAARSNPEAVNIDEFLALEHPESSHSLLMQRVEELVTNHDEDGDGKITREEYCRHRFVDLSEQEEKDRQREFDTVLDVNKNGVAEKKEVIQYMDPKHQHWAREEAALLVSLADRDSDQLLTLEEVLAQPLPFLTSKLVSPDRSFHGQL